MQLETNRLILRPPRVEDVDDYLEFRNSEFVLRYNAMRVLSREEAVEAFARVPGDEADLIMEVKATGKVIGMICIGEDSLRWGVSSRELSYFLKEAYTRRGYMKEALKAVIDCLFSRENVECIGARSFAPNTASRSLLTSLGFHQDGLIPRCVKGYADIIYDDAIYSLFAKR